MYTADEWRNALNEASGYSYDDIDVLENVGPLGTALVRAYEKFDQDEDKVTAAVEAGAIESESWDIEWFDKLVDGGVVVYRDMDEPLQDYLDDHYDGIKVEWLNETGRRELESAAVRESEIWAEITGTAVYVFNKPNQ